MCGDRGERRQQESKLPLDGGGDAGQSFHSACLVTPFVVFIVISYHGVFIETVFVSICLQHPPTFLLNTFIYFDAIPTTASTTVGGGKSSHLSKREGGAFSWDPLTLCLDMGLVGFYFFIACRGGNELSSLPTSLPTLHIFLLFLAWVSMKHNPPFGAVHP